ESEARGEILTIRVEVGKEEERCRGAWMGPGRGIASGDTSRRCLMGLKNVNDSGQGWETSFVRGESYIKRYINGEFDPGSGRTLAARLTHASRTDGLRVISGERVRNT